MHNVCTKMRGTRREGGKGVREGVGAAEEQGEVHRRRRRAEGEGGAWGETRA
jgi:hypothetical protein